MQQTTPAPKPAAAKPKPPTPPAQFREGSIATMDATGLIAILKNAASSEFEKSKACVRLGELAANEAVPVLAGLLGDERLSTYARYGLEPIADPAVDDALRAAMTRLKGNLQIGVINSIGKRRDAKAAPVLVKMMHGTDAELARTAASALGHIGTAGTAKDLQSAVARTNGVIRSAVADGCLVCAERLIADGHRDDGMRLYAFLSGPDIPKPARLGAMAAIIREETALNRPR